MTSEERDDFLALGPQLPALWRQPGASPAAGAGSTGGCRRGDHRPADPRRPSLGPMQLRPGAYGTDRSTASPRAARSPSDTPAPPPGVADVTCSRIPTTAGPPSKD